MKSNLVVNDKIPVANYQSNSVVATLIRAQPLKAEPYVQSKREENSNTAVSADKIALTTTVLWSERLSPTAARVRWTFPEDLLEQYDVASSLLLYTNNSTMVDRNWFKVLVMEPQRQVTVGGLKPDTNYYFKIYPRTAKTTIRYPSKIEKLDKEKGITKAEELCLKLCNVESPKECGKNEHCSPLPELGPKVAVCLSPGVSHG
ncbi:Mesocentin [Trichuris trichiura]|uniref:Mesocentin n=1 Tax=Trichuris trichiura TaxID=36087 RepID=A0A077Z003_TRITR|nr:Mesocentin [Trichuris trichiura]